MRQADFVHLHLHSAYSLLQSTIRLPLLVKKAREYRLPALAITDHGNLLGCIEFYDLAYSNGIKPIIGCELALDSLEGVDPERSATSETANHIVLLAKNRKGYQNLLQLITKAHSQGWQQDAHRSASHVLAKTVPFILAASYSINSYHMLARVVTLPAVPTQRVSWSS